MADILQATFSNAISWMKIIAILLEFQWRLFQGFQLIMSQRWNRYWLYVIKQNISWTNDDQDLN